MIKRIISAIVLIAIIGPLIYLGGKYFSLAITLVAMLGYKELLNLKYNKNKLPVLMQILGFIEVAALVLCNQDYSFQFGISYKILILLLIINLLPILFYKKDSYNSKDAFYLIGITLLIGVVFNSFILVRAFGMYKFIYLLLITVLTDTFAMIFGLLCGRHKLCPTISPKKSWEGSIAGSIIATTAACFFYKYFVGVVGFKVILFTLILSIIGQLGDLVFSRIKRDNDTKDYSNLIPGHGGILDRFDSLIFVTLTFVILVGRIL